jgi:nucleoside-diphosphate-sugar epimerase
VRVFLAGATGVIGRQLVPVLLAAGHEVTGTTRSQERADQLSAAGVRGVACDALDREAVRKAIAAAQPEAVIHQLTALPAAIDPRTIERDFVLNDRLRDEGTKILVDAAQETGAKRILAQSIAFSYVPGPRGTLHGEDDPLLSAAQTDRSYARSAEAVRSLERTVRGGAPPAKRVGGVVLRYGYFYGPGASFSRDGWTAELMRRRRLPVVGGGAGVWSFVHVRDAAEATLAALERGTAGAAYNIVDDDPAPVAEWVPALAAAVGAKPPRRVPAWLARPLAGRYGVTVMTRAQGASNERAKRDLGWTPAHPSWREGFKTALG